jgi:molybdenum cofactor cytidylyltransferase
MPIVGLIVLAAGASTRMGTPKQLLLFQGRSLLRSIAEAAIASRCNPIVVVLGSQADRIEIEVDALDLHSVVNLEWAKGMGTSIAAGMTALTSIESDLDAVVIAVSDQPFVGSDLLNRLVESYQATQSPIVASAYANTLGVPALFDRSFFTALMTIDRDVGARGLIERHAEKVVRVPFPDGAIDVDTPTQYQQLCSREQDIHKLYSAVEQ